MQLRSFFCASTDDSKTRNRSFCQKKGQKTQIFSQDSDVLPKAGAYNAWTFFMFFILFAEILFSSHIAPYSWTEFFYSRVFRIGRNCYDASPPLTVNHKTIILCRFEASRRHSFSMATSAMDPNRVATAPNEPNKGVRRPGSRVLPLVPLFRAPKWHPSRN